jgi:signal transduction histidine kinase/ActR/RegA family two-component response regulator
VTPLTETLYHQAFIQGFAAQVIVDLDTRVMLANNQALRYCYISREQFAAFVGQPLMQTPFFQAFASVGATEHFINHFVPAWQRALAGELVEFETRAPNPLGQVIVAAVALKPLRNSAGEVEHILIEGHDVSAFYAVRAEAIAMKTELEHSLSLQQAMFQQSALHLVLYDAALCFCDASLASCQAVQLTPAAKAALVGQHFSATPWWPLLYPQSEQVLAGMKQVLTGETIQLELQVPSSSINGSSNHEFSFLEVTYSPIRNMAGEISHVLVESHDVSADRNLRAGLERVNRSKSEFLSRMSHELRTPLNVMLGYSELLALDALPHQREALASVHEAGKHLLALINEVLDIARIEQGRLDLQLQPLPILALLEEVLTLVQPLAQRHLVQLRLHNHLNNDLVLADPQRLRQVMLNLLSNAIKYNRPSGLVEVSWQRQGQRLWLTVRDTGRGIAADKLERLFMPFDRLGIESSGIEGTGIGLTLSKALLEAMGSTISVESDLGVGSSFRFFLPILRDSTTSGSRQSRSNTGSTLGFDEQKPAASVSHPASKQRLRVFYIEDNDQNIKLIEKMLLLRPMVALSVFRDGQSGLAALGEALPDLLLLDLNLPDMHGHDILRILRATSQGHQLPVVVVSADVTANTQELTATLGVKAFLAKPFALQELLDTIDDFLDDVEIPATLP